MRKGPISREGHLSLAQYIRPTSVRHLSLAEHPSPAQHINPASAGYLSRAQHISLAQHISPAGHLIPHFPGWYRIL